ncbi:TPA: hypothetical protein PXP47_003911 [Yersinia enterocolitica]|nr:hypothetical protein [Yersinia enterocolitica]
MSYFLKDISADIFNQIYPIGSRFEYFPVMGIPDSIEVVTRTKAWVLGPNAVVVSVKGLVGGLSVRQMNPIATAPTKMKHHDIPLNTKNEQPNV